MVLLDSSEGDLQHALSGFIAVCCKAKIRINMARTETLVLPRRSFQCTLHISKASLRQSRSLSILEVFLRSDVKKKAELDNRVTSVSTGC